MSRATSVLPVILLLIFVAGAAWFGYQIYLYTQTLAQRGQRHMEKKNISFTADGGMRVGVKELRTEEYSDKTQNVLVKAWNLSEWPNHRSRFWNKEAQEKANAKTAAERSNAKSGGHASRSNGRSSGR